MVAVSILALGDVGYALAAREAIASVLDHSDFEVFVTCRSNAAHVIGDHPRLRKNILVDDVTAVRSTPFLEKFKALEWILATSSAEKIMHLDADAVLVNTLTEDSVRDALSDGELAMVEQIGIVSADMGRRELKEHYQNVTLPFLAPAACAPPLERFRFYNSGLVLSSRAGLGNFLRWAETLRNSLPEHHCVGEHMIADQDYFQVYANQVAPAACRELDWSWNHCAHWHTGFPKPNARIVHLSNFCNGPSPEVVEQLRYFRHAGHSDQVGDNTKLTDLTFIVVTYNSAAILGPCLDAALCYGDVIVVDNASSDGSADLARRRDIRLVQNRRNEGFAAAANAGAALASTRTICFLNPDCLVTAEVVEAALATLEQKDDQLVVPGYLEWSGIRTSGRQAGYTRTKILADLMETARHRPVARWLRRRRTIDNPTWFWPIGACLFMRTNVHRRLGGFASDYFCYMEDVAFGQKAAAAGIATSGLDQAVIHLGGHGAKIDARLRDELLDHARLTYARLQYGRLFVFMALGMRKGLTSLRLLRAAFFSLMGAA